MKTRVGAVAWLLATQFFVVQPIVAAAWETPFTLKDRFISDLGNSACGVYPAEHGTLVCSPWHAWMNASFIILGVTMAIGALGTMGPRRRRRTAGAAAALFTVAGLGLVLLGVYPENENLSLHRLGAGVNLITGNVALMLFGMSEPDGLAIIWRRSAGIIFGATGLIGTLLFANSVYLGLGPGGMERVAAYPMPLWQMMTGSWILLHAHAN